MKVYTSENIRVEYTGTVIYKDRFVGEDSMRGLMSDFQKESIDFSELYGCFSIAIHNVLDGSVIFFCDNMGYMPIYYTVTGTPIFSRSLIDMVERTGKTEKDLDWNAIFSFLEFGFCYSNLTFFKNIKKCSGDYIYKIENECIHITQKACKYKNIKNIDDYIKQLKRILSAFKKEKVLFDITGGTDSRLLVCLAESIGLNYELFVRGHSSAVDIKIARKIAALLNKPLYVMEAKAFDEFTDGSFLKLFTELDGVYTPLEGFQLLEAYKMRRQTGCTYNIGGLGGEYYKTFWLVRNKKINGSYTNAVFLREKLIFHGLHDSIKEVYHKYNDSLINELDIEDKNKLTTYFNWYRQHFFQRKSGALYALSSKYIPAYSPLSEMIFMPWIYTMPISDRILKIFYRKIIARDCPKLGELPTNTNISLSLRPLKLCNDLFVSFFRFIKRVNSKIFTGKMYATVVERVSADTNENLLKNSAFLQDAYAVLQKKNILYQNIDFSMMSLEMVDRYLVIWFWFTKFTK